MQQEPETFSDDARPKTSFFSVLWSTLAVVMGVGVISCALWGYAQINANNTREEASATFPWQGEGITIKSMTAWWKSSRGDARMEMRAAYYPVARIKLGECTGDGMISVIFMDAMRRQIGEPIHIPYRKGQFPAREENWVRASGDTATCRLETGFDTEEELTLHRIQPNTPLWRVRVVYRPAGEAVSRELGYVTVNLQEAKTEE